MSRIAANSVGNLAIWPTYNFVNPTTQQISLAACLCCTPPTEHFASRDSIAVMIMGRWRQGRVYLMATIRRHAWSNLTDAQLLEQCEVDTYRASGPGGQKRNKTSSAVRIRHPPSGLIVIAEESRSQHENRARALRRLRQALVLKIRDEAPLEMWTHAVVAARPDYHAARGGDGRLDLGRKDPRYWPAVGVVLDVLHAVEARVSDAAEILGISTGNLIAFLRSDAKVWEQANHMRARFGHKPLRSA
jgi:hypothetical protein